MAQLFSNTSHDVVLGVRNVTSAKSLTSKFNLKLTIKTAKQAINNADIVILAVTDSSIEELCHSLEKHFKTGAIVTHCSGALSSSILQSARESDCHIASTHPLNSFPNIAASLEKFSTAKHGGVYGAPTLGAARHSRGDCGDGALSGLRRCGLRHRSGPCDRWRLGGPVRRPQRRLG